MSDAALLDHLVDATKEFPSWAVFRRAVQEQRNIHLAVMLEPYLSYILEGKKSIESRFSKNAIAPFSQISPGELVLLKLSGGPIVGCFTTETVEFVGLNAQEFARLRDNYSDAICADEEFWLTRQDKRFATLVGVCNARELRPAPVAKSDRRGWIVLRHSRTNCDTEQLTLV